MVGAVVVFPVVVGLRPDLVIIHRRLMVGLIVRALLHNLVIRSRVARLVRVMLVHLQLTLADKHNQTALFNVMVLVLHLLQLIRLAMVTVVLHLPMPAGRPIPAL